MRYMMFHSVDERKPDAFNPSPELIANMGNLMGEMMKAGVLLAGEGLRPSDTGARITFSDGKRTVVDGPFTEAKEVVAGFAIVQVKSKDEAMEWASRFADCVGDVTVEVRQVAEMSDIDPSAAPE